MTEILTHADAERRANPAGNRVDPSGLATTLGAEAAGDRSDG